MSRRRKPTAKRASEAASQQAGSYAVGKTLARFSWWALLALCAITPLAITNLSFGGAHRSLTYDMVNLPKLLAVIVCSGLGLATYAASVALGAEKPRYHITIVLVWALAAWSAFTAFLSPMSSRAVFGDFDHNEGVVAFVAYAVVATLAIQVVRDASRVRKVALTLGTSAAIVALYSLLQFLRMDPLAWPPTRFGDRIFGTFENPDMLGAFLVMPLALMVGIAVSEEERGRDFWIASVSSGLIAVAIVLTLVRGAWLGAACALVALVVAARGVKLAPEHRTRLKGLLIALGIAIVVTAGLSHLAPQTGLSVGERLRTTVADTTGGSMGERFATWRIASKALLARPVFGYSPGSFLDVFRLNAGASWWRVFGHLLSERDAHDLALQYAITIGIPGALLAIAGVLVALAQGAKLAFRKEVSAARLPYAAVLAGTLGVFVALLSSPTMAMVAVWLWLGVGVLSAAHARQIDRIPDIGCGAFALVALALVVFVAVGPAWWRADAIAARASASNIAEESLAGMDAAIAANPLCHEYKVQKASIATYALQTAVNSGLDRSTALNWADGAVKANEQSWADDPYDAVAAMQTVLAMNARFDIAPNKDAASLAAGAATRALARWPNMPDVCNEAARAYLRAGSLDRALTNAQKACRLDPSFAGAWLTLGQIHIARGAEGEARTALQRAVQLDPSNAQASSILATLGSGSSK